MYFQIFFTNKQLQIIVNHFLLVGLVYLVSYNFFTYVVSRGLVYINDEPRNLGVFYVSFKYFISDAFPWYLGIINYVIILHVNHLPHQNDFSKG